MDGRIATRRLSPIHRQGAKVARYLPAWLICTVFCTYLSLQFEANNYLHDYQLHIQPLNDHQLSLTSFTLSGLDFSQVEAIVISLDERRSAAVSLIAESGGSEFIFARISNFISLPAGYYRSRDGLVEFHLPLAAETDSVDRFVVPFWPNLLPKPSRELSIVVQPDRHFMHFRSLPPFISRLSVRHNNGRVRTLDLSPLLPWPLTAAAGLILAIMFTACIDIIISRNSRLALYRHRFLLTQFLGSLWLTAFMLFANAHQITGTNATKAFLLVVACLLFVWSVFGCYPVLLFFRPLRHRLLDTVLYSIIILLFFVLLTVLAAALPWLTSRNFNMPIEAKHDFSTFASDRTCPVIMCLGGSSTKGSPFRDDWPYSYPRLLEKRLQNLFPDIVVLNGGIDGMRLIDCLPELPALVNKFHPRVVTFNFSWNDFYSKRPDRQFIHDYSQQLASANRIVAESGGSALFVLEPTFAELYLKSANAETMIALSRSLYRKLDLAIVDPYPRFADRRSGFLFVDRSVHLTRYGADLLADVLTEHIEPLLDHRAPNE